MISLINAKMNKDLGTNQSILVIHCILDLGIMSSTRNLQRGSRPAGINNEASQAHSFKVRI